MPTYLNTVVSTQRGYNASSPVNEYDYESQNYAVERPTSTGRAINSTALSDIILPVVSPRQKLYVSSTRTGGTNAYLQVGKVNGASSQAIANGTTYIFTGQGQNFTASLS